MQRYTLKVEMFVWAEDDEQAKEIAEKKAKEEAEKQRLAEAEALANADSDDDD